MKGRQGGDRRPRLLLKLSARLSRLSGRCCTKIYRQLLCCVRKRLNCWNTGKHLLHLHKHMNRSRNNPENHNQVVKVHRFVLGRVCATYTAYSQYQTSCSSELVWLAVSFCMKLDV